MKQSILLLILDIFYRKEVKEMALVYAYAVIEGWREFSSFNKKIQPAIKRELERLGFGELAQ